MRRIRPGIGGARKCGIGVPGTIEYVVERQQLADKTSGADGHIMAVAPDQIGHGFGGLLGLGESWFAGTGVRATGIQNDGLELAVRHDAARPLHGRRAESVRGEHAGCRVKRTVVDDEGKILLALYGGDTGFHACGGKALCKGNAHGATPILVRP